MRYLFSLLMIVCLFSCANDNNQKDSQTMPPKYALVIHGGAGTIERSSMDSATEKAYVDALNFALDTGEKILKEGGKSIDAVEAVIKTMEDNPLFNAGKGAVFTNEGKNELDASIMTGDDQKAGAIGGVTTVKHPISLARAVMEKSEHVMMVGKGAEAFAAKCSLEIVDPSYFFTERRYNSLQKILKEDSEKVELSEDEKGNKKHGTVGCVALDLQGNITAGTSTGGMTNKKFNRIGDAPIIGAGTFADNKTCGVSCTGHGEFFIRYTVARDIAAMMEYKGSSLKEACDYIIYQKLVEKGGEGGLIAIDHQGNIEMPFNSSGMYRGWAKEGQREVKIYKD
ncbi:MAG: isoaspartyl peptidase/L-asparaginase [Saprospiraceae bacterium]|nr:isoaspartyl peptidase/L-asparaginase [Saprospiraceae bacterium]MBK8633390.1 isoaspartyl peptidase/L-asparaginase [Saprospiraceae bacterium]